MARLATAFIDHFTTSTPASTSEPKLGPSSYG
jgi:hypothetical protein